MNTLVELRARPVGQIMQKNVRCINMDHTVAQAEAFLHEHRLSWAPVAGANGEPIGVLSVDDLMRFRVQTVLLLETPVWRLCTYRPVVVGPDTPVGEVARIMIERRFHHVVIAEDGLMRGVVSSLDLVRLLA